MPVGIYLKAVGCICLLAGSAGTGGSLAAQYVRRLRELAGLRQMIVFLKGQIVYAGVPLAEAFDEVGRRSRGAPGRLFADAAARLFASPGEPFAQLWEEAVGGLGKDCALSPEDRQSLLRLSEYLGCMDRGTQERNLLLYLEELDGLIAELRAQKKERCRLYTGLGVMGGMFLAILLC